MRYKEGEMGYLEDFDAKIHVYSRYSLIEGKRINKTIRDLATKNAKIFEPSEQWPEWLLEFEAEKTNKYWEIVYFSTKEDFSIWQDKVHDFSIKNEEQYNKELLINGAISVVPSEINKKEITIINNAYDLEGMYTELAKIEPFNNKQLINFCEIFGIPDGFEPAIGGDQLSFKDGNIRKQFSFLLSLYTDLTLYRFVFNAWIAVKENNKELIRYMEDKYKKFMKNQYHKDLLSIITFFLDQNVYSNEVRFKLKNNQISRFRNYDNLLSIAYEQLIIAMIDDTPFKRCDNCGHPFELTHEGRRFCPPLPGRKRSRCENTYNQRLKRQKQKLKKKGDK